MVNNLNAVALYCHCKIDAAFRRLFKEQAGAAELVATLVIVGIALALALAFRTQLIGLVKGLWNQLVHGGSTDADVNSGAVTSEWT